MTQAEKEKGGSQVTINVNVNINLGEMEEEIQLVEKREVSKRANPIPIVVLRSAASYAAVKLQEEYPSLVQFTPTGEPKSDVFLSLTDTGKSLYKGGFKVGQVADVILALDSLSNLKEDKQLEAQFERTVVEAVNELYPSEGRIDIDEYFASRSQTRK